MTSHTMRPRWPWLMLAVFVFGLPYTFASADPLSQDLAERKLAKLLELIENSSEPVARTVSSQLLATDWPVTLTPTVTAALSKVVEHPDADLEAAAVRVFAERNGADAAFLVRCIAAALPTRDRSDAVELLRAVRAIGPRADSLEEVVRSKLQDSDPVVVIYAASALIRIAPANRYARAKLLSYLMSRDSEDRLRAADAMAHARVMDERWVAELETLLKDDDVRVRVTSANAFWRITNDAKVSLPVLIDSLAEDDTSLATAFVYPSFSGDSHRVYALDAVAAMGPAGKSAIPDIVSVVKEVASAETPISVPYAIVGLAALRAIRQLGHVTEAEFKEISESVGCGDCAFTLVQDHAQKALALLKPRSN